MLTDPHHRYPGTQQHQAVLRALVAHYENDPRILAVAVFGSLGAATGMSIRTLISMR